MLTVTFTSISFKVISISENILQQKLNTVQHPCLKKAIGKVTGSLLFKNKNLTPTQKINKFVV